jgi:hypothetical protein
MQELLKNPHVLDVMSKGETPNESMDNGQENKKLEIRETEQVIF